MLPTLPYEAPPTVLQGPGIKLVLNVHQVFPDDPGNGTPAIVETNSGLYTATYDCACGTEELDGGRRGMKQLNHEQLLWLDEQQRYVDEVWRQGQERNAIRKARAGK